MTNIIIARQPILKRDGSIYGYEMLYRNADISHAEIVDGTQATNTTLANLFVEFGFEQMVGTYKAFINLTRSVVDNLPELPIEPQRIVLEILENTPVDYDLVERLKQLKNLGYPLAIDDYVFEERWLPIMSLVDIVKVDLPQIHTDKLPTYLAQYKNKFPNIMWLAEKVETHAQFAYCKKIGFDFFQGYFFARPENISQIVIQENTIVTLSLISHLANPNVTLDEIVSLIKKDPALSMKVLRSANSALVAARTPIESIDRAILLLGFQRIRQWAILLSLKSNSNSGSLLATLELGLIRANFCSTLIKSTNSGDEQIAYTIGLLSVLDAIVNMPMQSILEHCPLPSLVQEALLHHQNHYGNTLKLAEQFELERQTQHPTNPEDESRLNEIYQHSIKTATQELTAIAATF